MCAILSNIVMNEGSFSESTFEGIEKEGLTRAWIAKFFGLDPDFHESNQQLEVVDSIFFHLVDELYSRGCTKSEICSLSRLTAQYWAESIAHSLQENIRRLPSVVSPLVPNPVSERAATIYLEYTVSSFLQHFALYRACLLASPSDRFGRQLRRRVQVEAPEPPCPLRDGLRPEEYQYRCQLREIDTEEQIARAAGVERRLGEAATLAQRRRDLEDGTGNDEVEQEDSYPHRLIGELLEMNVRQMRLRTQDMTDTSTIDLVYKAKRTALPRPASMGPPPRYQTSAGGGGGDRKSAASSRSSAKSKTGGGDGKRSKAAK